MLMQVKKTQVFSFSSGVNMLSTLRCCAIRYMCVFDLADNSAKTVTAYARALQCISLSATLSPTLTTIFSSWLLSSVHHRQDYLFFCHAPILLFLS